MLKFRKKAKINPYSLPLTLQALDGTLYRTFDSTIISSFRHMLTDLAANGELPKRIAMVSALRGEGVTYNTLALATTLASDTLLRICVVDLNWWSPGVVVQMDSGVVDQLYAKRRFFWQKKPAPAVPVHLNRPGIAQVLAGDISLDDALIPTEIPNLSLLPAGDVPMVRRPVIARSSELRDLINTLSERFDHLLLDVPAVLTTSDAIVLASLSDACCVVVRQGVTSTISVQQALDDLKHLTILGVVLNRVSIHTPRLILSLIPQE